MFDKDLYAGLKKTDPLCFETAEMLYDTVLDKQRMVVRASITRLDPKNHLFEIVRIEVIDLEYGNSLEDRSDDVMFRLCFRAETDFLENEIQFLETLVEVSGPTYDGKRLEKEDFVNQLATHVSEWKRSPTFAWDGRRSIPNPWVYSPAKPFVSCLVLPHDLVISLPAHHPLVLPYISMCYVSFKETFGDKMATLCSSSLTSSSQTIRMAALRSFEKRLNSFVVQMKRESMRYCFGSFLD